MRALLALVVVAVIAFFVVPMAVEGTTNTCQALEKHTVSQTASNIAGGTSGPVYGAINGVGQAGATGQVASTMMNQSHPDTPSPVSCTYYYWKSMF
jgi:hypothetical protein